MENYPKSLFFVWRQSGFTFFGALTSVGALFYFYYTEEKMKTKKLISLLLFVVTITGFILTGCQCKHEWQPATCTSPKTCTKCGLTEGTAIEHTWKAATCTTPKKCSQCGLTEGLEAGHKWTNATCTTPKKCTVCGLTQGKANGHSWVTATCTEAKHCSVCGQKEGSALGHNYVDYICTRCKKSNVTRADVPNILDIKNPRYKVNSVGGINQYMTFVNKSSTKTIKYIYITLAFKNAVGDVIKNDIGGGTTAILQYTGPLAPGKSSGEKYWDAVFYNSTFSGTMDIRYILIEYMDGTSLAIEDSIAENAVVSWR